MVVGLLERDETKDAAHQQTVNLRKVQANTRRGNLLHADRV
jgi:hypothetical protein